MKTITVAAALATLAFTAGCQTENVNTVERAAPNAQPNYVADKRVVTDASLAGKIQILNVAQAMVSGDILKIQVRVENKKSHGITFRYRVEWYDGAGMIISSPTDLWKTYQVQGRETGNIEAVATSPKAVDFVIKIQEN